MKNIYILKIRDWRTNRKKKNESNELVAIFQRQAKRARPVVVDVFNNSNNNSRAMIMTDE